MNAITPRSRQASALMFCTLAFVSLLTGCPRHLATDQAAEQTRAMSGSWSDDLPQDGSLTVSLRALLVTAKSERPIVEQETLHAGDHLYFLLRTSQPAYLYVVLFGPEGEASVLFPRDPASGSRVAARCPVRVPSQGSFYLQHPAGLQDLRVVASTEPLAQSDPRLCEQLRLPCEKMKPEPVPQCPQEQARALFSALKVATAVPGKGTGAVASLRLLLTQEP